MAQAAYHRPRFRFKPKGSGIRPLLRYSPPDTTGYTVVNLTNANNSPTLDNATDYLFVMPKTPITVSGGIVLNGGRNRVIIGGEIWVPKQWPTNGKPITPGGFPQQQITMTATGGTWQVSNENLAGAVETTPALAWNITAADLKTALEALPGIGAGTIFSVVLVGTVYTIIPVAPNFTVQRLTLTTASLTGGTASIDYSGNWADMRGLYMLNGKGIDYVEGLWIHGPGCEEAMDFSMTNGAPGQFYIQNCHFANLSHDFELSNFHGDALQIWAGPAELYMDRCTFHGRYQALTLQPTTAGTPDRLTQWHISNVNVSATNPADNTQPPASEGPGYPLFISGPSRSAYPAFYGSPDDGPLLDNVWGYAPTRLASQLFFPEAKTPPAPRFNVGTPPEGDFCNTRKYDCGVGYVTPGYL